MKKYKKTIVIVLVILVIILLIVISKKKQLDSLPKEVDAEKPDELIKIESNEFNQYNYELISENQIIVALFDLYKEKELYAMDEAFDMLDNEYRDTRFNGINDFKNFINDNIYQRKMAYVYKFDIHDYKDYKQYVIMDQYNNYYIFNETSPMKYKVLLDTYTIDIPEFIEKYDGLNEKNKVALNIEKFIKAMNYKDYNYAYNCLDKKFKENNYPTIEDFKIFAEEKLFKNSKINFISYTNEGKTNIYDIELTDESNIENGKINMQIIMKLKENRDFVMSFSLQ